MVVPKLNLEVFDAPKAGLLGTPNAKLLDAPDVCAAPNALPVPNPPKAPGAFWVDAPNEVDKPNGLLHKVVWLC